MSDAFSSPLEVPDYEQELLSDNLVEHKAKTCEMPRSLQPELTTDSGSSASDGVSQTNFSCTTSFAFIFGSDRVLSHFVRKPSNKFGS